MNVKKDGGALLKVDHLKVEELFEKFEAVKGRDEKAALAKEIRTELMIHSTIEKQNF